MKLIQCYKPATNACPPGFTNDNTQCIKTISIANECPTGSTTTPKISTTKNCIANVLDTVTCPAGMTKSPNNLMYYNRIESADMICDSNYPYDNNLGYCANNIEPVCLSGYTVNNRLRIVR